MLRWPQRILRTVRLNGPHCRGRSFSRGRRMGRVAGAAAAGRAQFRQRLTAVRFLCASKRRRAAVSYRATTEINFTRRQGGEEKRARDAAVERRCPEFPLHENPSRRFFRSYGRAKPRPLTNRCWNCAMILEENTSRPFLLLWYKRERWRWEKFASGLLSKEAMICNVFLEDHCPEIISVLRIISICIYEVCGGTNPRANREEQL